MTFYVVRKLISMEDLKNALGGRAVFMAFMFLLFSLTVILSIALSHSPLSFEYGPAFGLALGYFLGMVLTVWAIMEFVPAFIKTINSSISFAVLVIWYKFWNTSYTDTLNKVLQDVFVYESGLSKTNITLFDEGKNDFPYYFLMNYLSWDTIEDFVKTFASRKEDDYDDTMKKIQGYGIVPKSYDPEAVERLKDRLFELFWTSYFMVINFAMNAALITIFVIMMIDPKPKK